MLQSAYLDQNSGPLATIIARKTSIAIESGHSFAASIHPRRFQGTKRIHMIDS